MARRERVRHDRGCVTRFSPVSIDAHRPALVVVDVQRAIDDPVWGPRNNPAAEDVIEMLLGWWRRAEFPVFHVRHDSTDVSSPYRPGQPGNDFKPQASPLATEAVISKSTNSAFIGTDLAERLDRSGCDAVVFIGVITNNSLEATVRNSGNLGYRSFVVEDACWAVDKTDLRGRRWDAEDVHALALANMHGEYATVINSASIDVRAAGSGCRSSPGRR